MATDLKTIVVRPGSELAEVLEQAAEAPLMLEKNGQRYRVKREPDDPFANYDPELVQQALDEAFGILKRVDIEELLADLREQREQDSIGRPA